MILQANGIHRKAGVAILMSDKNRLQVNKGSKRQGLFIMIKGTRHQKDTILLNIYAPNSTQRNKGRN